MALVISGMGMGMAMAMSLKMPKTGTRTRTSLGQGSSSFFKGSTLSPPSFLSMRRKKNGAASVAVVARKVLQGKVVCATNDKTVRVQVFRLAVHPKYKKRVKVKKNYQAHDPANTFKVGDMVELHSCRPISKTKAFLALPLTPRNNVRLPSDPLSLSLPLQSLTT